MNDKFIDILTYFEIIVLAIILILIIRNVLKYVIKDERYKEFHIAGFYPLAFVIVSLRIAEKILLIYLNNQESGANKVEKRLLYQTWAVFYTCR